MGKSVCHRTSVLFVGAPCKTVRAVQESRSPGLAWKLDGSEKPEVSDKVSLCLPVIKLHSSLLQNSATPGARASLRSSSDQVSRSNSSSPNLGSGTYESA